jgi:hypothetical protein
VSTLTVIVEPGAADVGVGDTKLNGTVPVWSGERVTPCALTRKQEENIPRNIPTKRLLRMCCDINIPYCEVYRVFSIR